MPTNSHPLEQGGAFYVDEDGLKNIVSAVKKFTGSDYSLNVDFDDDFSHTTHDIDSLLKHPHFRMSNCKYLRVSSSSDFRHSDRKNISISFKEGLGQGSISASISSSNDDIHIVRAELIREIKSFRTRYDILYRVPGLAWFIFGILTGVFLGMKSADILISASEDQSRQTLANINGTMITVSIFCVMSALYLLGKFKNILFPRFTVAIGKQKDRFEKLQDTRKWAYRAILLSIIGYAINVLYIWR